MKKRLVKVLALTGAIMMFATGCGKVMECEMCGEEKKCSKVTYEGESAYLCGDCEEAFEAIAGLAEALGGLE